MAARILKISRVSRLKVPGDQVCERHGEEDCKYLVNTALRANGKMSAFHFSSLLKISPNL